jgi:zinc transporter ZupT
MDMKQHVTVVAALNIGLGVLGIVVAIIAFVFLAGIGILSGDRDAMPILTFIATVAGGFLFVVSVPDVIGGIGLIKGQSWARILVLILSVLKLINFPLGTIVGVYSIWVLMQDEAAELLSR